MNLGLGTLTDLKTQLLNEALRPDTRYDVALAALGRGVAARFENYCGRKFGRVVGEVYQCCADRPAVVVPRYPIEQITKIEAKWLGTSAWVEQTPRYLLDESAGIVEFADCPLGTTYDLLRLTYDGGYWVPSTTAVVVVTGTVTVAAGLSAAAVDFGEAFAALPTVRCQPQAAQDGTLITVQAQDVTLTGCALRLAAPAPTGGLVVTWVATLGGDEADPAVLQAGRVTLTAAAESQAVTFGTAFAAAPVVTCSIVAPSGGLVIDSVPTLVTATGFTAALGFPIPDAGYTLHWQAVSTTASSSAPVLPAGATALPDDLKLAWLMQCEHLWRLRDAQGVSLADDKKSGVSPELTLARANLVPEVKEILNGYVRYSLS